MVTLVANAACLCGLLGRARPRPLDRAQIAFQTLQHFCPLCARPFSKGLADLGGRLHFGHASQPLSSEARSVDSKSLVTLPFLGAFGAFQGLQTYCAGLSAPD